MQVEHTNDLPLVGRSKNAKRFSGGGPLFVAGTAPPPDVLAGAARVDLPTSGR